MRSLVLLCGRLVVGTYLAIHGAQKLFGVFGGRGIEGTAAGFERQGLTPGKPMAITAGVCELGGGVLTATGAAHPLGPVAVAGAMAVAASVHRPQGPLAAKGGFELPLTNCVAAAVLAATGPGRLALGRRLHPALGALTAVGAAGIAGVLVSKVLKAQARAQVEARQGVQSTSQPSATPSGSDKAQAASVTPTPTAAG
jgi:putative oxidoreductase